MADDKKPEQKDVKTEIIALLIGLAFLALIVARIEQYFEYLSKSHSLTIWGWIVAFFFTHIWPVIKVSALIVTAASTVGIIYNVKKINEIAEEDEKLYGRKHAEIESGETEVSNRNEKWEKVIEHINSTNSSDWRLAIIEADIMLEDLLRASGYHGDSVSEMLKSIEASDFLTLDEAWSGHKVRNRIAHQGSDFPLNEREAKQAIACFEAVFKEFKII